jgi:hypothetical protein
LEAQLELVVTWTGVKRLKTGSPHAEVLSFQDLLGSMDEEDSSGKKSKKSKKRSQ